MLSLGMEVAYDVKLIFMWTGRSRKMGGLSMLLAMPPVIMKERINKKRVKIMNEAIRMVNEMRKKEVDNQVSQVGTYCDQST